MWDSSDPELAQWEVGNTMSMETLRGWVMPVQVDLGPGLGKEGLACLFQDSSVLSGNSKAPGVEQALTKF